MDTLLVEVLRWLMTNNYRRASFDRIIGIVPSASTYEQLTSLIYNNGEIFQEVTIKGGLPGLKVHDDVNISALLNTLTDHSIPIANTGITAAPTTTSVTHTAIENEIVSEYYLNVGNALGIYEGPQARVTLCILTLSNEFTVIGKSACIYPENFNEATGRILAREDAIRQLWVLLGFRLADRRMNAL